MKIYWLFMQESENKKTIFCMLAYLNIFVKLRVPGYSPQGRPTVEVESREKLM